MTTISNDMHTITISTLCSILLVVACLLASGCSTTIGISSTPSGASVFFNDTDTGMKTPAEIPVKQLPVGRTYVTVIKNGYVSLPLKQEIEVRYSKGNIFWSWFPPVLIKNLCGNRWKGITYPRNRHLHDFEMQPASGNLAIQDGGTSQSLAVINVKPNANLSGPDQNETNSEIKGQTDLALTSSDVINLKSKPSISPNAGPQVSEQTVILKTSTKEILIFEGDTSRAYTVLGSVEYKHDKGVAYGSTLDLSMEVQKLVKDGLKSVAFTKYGNKVDAIINVKMGKNIAGGYFGTIGAGFGAKNTIVSGTGVAISYKSTH